MALNNRLNPSHIGTTNRFLHDIMARKELLPTTPGVMVGGRWWNPPPFQGGVSAVVQAVRKTCLGTQIGDGFFSFLLGALPKLVMDFGFWKNPPKKNTKSIIQGQRNQPRNLKHTLQKTFVSFVVDGRSLPRFCGKFQWKWWLVPQTSSFWSDCCRFLTTKWDKPSIFEGIMHK